MLAMQIMPLLAFIRSFNGDFAVILCWPAGIVKNVVGLFGKQFVDGNLPSILPSLSIAERNWNATWPPFTHLPESQWCCWYVDLREVCTSWYAEGACTQANRLAVFFTMLYFWHVFCFSFALLFLYFSYHAMVGIHPHLISIMCWKSKRHVRDVQRRC